MTRLNKSGPSSSAPALPRRLEVLLDNALKSPDTHLGSFSRVQFEQYGFLSFHPRVIDAYTRQFYQPPPTSIFSPGVQAAEIAIRRLFEITILDGFEATKPVLLSVWPKMWKWIDFLYRHLPRLDDDNHSTMTYIQALLGFLILHDPVECTEVISTKGVLELVFIIWIQLAEYPPDDELGMLIVNAGQMLIVLIRSSLIDIQEPGAAVDYYQTLGRNAITLLLETIKMGTRGDSPYSRYLPLIFRVHAVLCEANPEFYLRVPTKSLISTICEALWFAASCPPSNNESEEPKPEFAVMQPRNSIATAIALLYMYTSTVAYGYSWVIYALRYNLLSFLFECMHMECSGRNDIDCFVSELLDQMKMFVIYRPVLRHLRQETILNSTFEDIEDEKLRFHWISLAKTVRLYSSKEKSFDRVRGYTLQCTYAKCPSARKSGNRIISDVVPGARVLGIAQPSVKGTIGKNTVIFAGHIDLTATLWTFPERARSFDIYWNNG
ncbi:hypothetical protein C0995_001340 [Termitomyces sp. Mi166|nr:hypothetical protein C0995_001340 [Termitomyces sp. Mi166\